MKLIDQHTKKIMEGCKDRAREMGLTFEKESLEYIVTNRDLLELSPKVMIPTLYDYWVHDVEVMREKGKYELYPGNPYETVINTRPAISFYNDNNPDWLNVMIFYHVIGHIDFFQNNHYFRHTWDYDFNGQALSDKRLIAKLRAEKGRWVDYVIEFARSIDNLAGYHAELSRFDKSHLKKKKSRLDYYFDVFLQNVKKVAMNDYIKEIDRYNACQKEHDKAGDETFFAEIDQKHPEFMALYRKYRKGASNRRQDVMQYILDHSEFLNKDENKWMKSIVEVVRNTSLFFQPQIRTKIMNEGWASYWHETLFLQDDRIKGHEVEFARVNAGVTSMPRVGLNPYALGLRLFYYIEEMADKGKYSFEFDRLLDTHEREQFDKETGSGRDYIFKVRESYSDFTFLNTFINQDFVTRNDVFVTGRRLNKARMVWEYYVKSRKADDYKQMMIDQLYHPPFIEVHPEKSKEGMLYLIHIFEGKPLVADYIANTLLGIEFLWGKPVQLETHVVESITPPEDDEEESEVEWQRVLYIMENRRLSKLTL